MPDPNAALKRVLAILAKFPPEQQAEILKAAAAMLHVTLTRKDNSDE